MNYNHLSIDELIIAIFTSSDANYYYDMATKNNAYSVTLRTIGKTNTSPTTNRIFNVLLTNNINIPKKYINQYINYCLNELSKSYNHAYGDICEIFYNLHLLHKKYQLSEENIDIIKNSNKIHPHYFGLILLSFPHYCKKMKTLLIKKSIYKPFIDKITQNQFDSIINNPYVRFTYQDFIEITKNKTIHMSHFKKYCEKDYSNPKYITNDDIEIIVHMVKIFGLNFDILKNVINFVGERLMHEYPDKKEIIYKNITKKDVFKAIKLENVLDDKNIILKYLGLNVHIYNYMLTYILQNYPQSEHAIKNYNFNIYKFLTSNNFVPNQKTLEIICKFSHDNYSLLLFDDLVEKYKFVPNYECLKNLIKYYVSNDEKYSECNNENIFNKIMKYKITIDNDIVMIAIKNKYPKINELINNCINIDKNIGIELIKNKIFIEDMERVGMKYDEELYYYCHIHNFFPDEFINKFTIEPNIIKMRHKYANDKLINIIKFIEKHNLYPDVYCVDNSVINKNRDVMTYLINNKFRFSIHCLNLFHKVLYVNNGKDMDKMIIVSDYIYKNKYFEELNYLQMSAQFSKR